MFEPRAIAVGPFVTATQLTEGSVMLHTPSDQIGDNYVPPQEIYLSPENIDKLYQWLHAQPQEDKHA